MNSLLDLVLLVVVLFTSMSVLLYVLTVIDPQTERRTTELPGLQPTSGR